jgi:hypothetical protein
MSIFVPVIFGLVVTFVLEVFLATTLNNILFAYPVLCPVLSPTLFISRFYLFLLPLLLTKVPFPFVSLSARGSEAG